MKTLFLVAKNRKQADFNAIKEAEAAEQVRIMELRKNKKIYVKGIRPKFARSAKCPVKRFEAPKVDMTEE